MSTVWESSPRKPRHEVISIRLNEDRLKLLERYQRLLSTRQAVTSLWPKLPSW